MDKQELADSEMKKLKPITRNFVQRVEHTLEDIRNEKVKLFLTEKDQYRLLILRVWEDKYKIDLRYILQTLVPFWEGFIQRRSKKMKSRGLNVKVSTLTGKKSEQILVDSISKSFPNRENFSLWIAYHKERIIQNHLKQETRSQKEFSTPGSYLRYYRKQLKTESKLREQITADMKSRNYRNNPFREETCR